MLQQEQSTAASPSYLDGAFVEFGSPVRDTRADQPSSVEDLLALLDQERSKHQPRVREAILVNSKIWAIPIALFGLWWSLVNGNQTNAVLSIVCVLLILSLGRFVASRRQAEAARILARFTDVRVAGPLAEALEWPDMLLRVTAAAALTRMLPRMRASDSGCLSPGQRACLYRRLRPNAIRTEADAHLATAILKALEQVGDERALPHVQRLAELRGRSQDRRRVRDAAAACLPFLQARVEQSRAGATLLRATQVDRDRDLVRPASGGAPDTATLPRSYPVASQEAEGFVASLDQS